jgi:hypothetical protein
VGWLVLTKDQVEAFLGAQKWVRTETAGSQVTWEISGTTTAVAVLPVDWENGDVATLRLVTSYVVWRNWNFVLQLGPEEVYAWHLDSNGKHRNVGCPSSFPRKVVQTPHEHLWIEGHDLTCAFPLADLSDTHPSSHRECLEAFCDRIDLHFEPAYVGPPSGEQMILVFGGEGA